MSGKKTSKHAPGKKIFDKAGDNTTSPDAQDVYVDLLFDSGLIYLVLCNRGVRAATRIRVAFDKPLYGADNIDVSNLGVFKHLSYLPAGKHIEILVDETHSFFAKRQRSVVKLSLSWNTGKTKLSSTITHDMRAYADFPYLSPRPENRSFGHLQ